MTGPRLRRSGTQARGRARRQALLEAARSLLETRGLAATPISLDQRVLADGSSLEAILADASATDPQVEVVDHERTGLVDTAVAELPERQREILTRHFGLGRSAEEIAEVAAALHLSQQRTRAIEREALCALRERLEAQLDHEARRVPGQLRIRTSPRPRCVADLMSREATRPIWA